MKLALVDWLIVAGYFALSTAIGLAFTRRGGESLEEYFISGRKVPWWLAGAAMIPMGFTIMAFMITGNTMLQLRARPEARGRVMALYGIVFLGSTPIGAPLAGLIGEHLGPRVGFVLSGLVAGGLGAALLAARHRRARAAGQTRSNEGVETSAGSAIATR